MSLTLIKSLALLGTEATVAAAAFAAAGQTDTSSAMSHLRPFMFVCLFYKLLQLRVQFGNAKSSVYYGMTCSVALCVNVCSRKRRGISKGLLQLLWTVACSALTWPV